MLLGIPSGQIVEIHEKNSHILPSGSNVNIPSSISRLKHPGTWVKLDIWEWNIPFGKLFQIERSIQ